MKRESDFGDHSYKLTRRITCTCLLVPVRSWMSGFRRVKALNRGIGKEKRRSFRLAAESPRQTAVIRLAACAPRSAGTRRSRR